MRRSWIGGLLAATFMLTGCYTISYKGKGSPSGVEKDQWGDYFLWGLVGENNVDLQQMCNGGVARWKSQATFVQGLIGIVTLGIYVPRTVMVQCASGTALEIQLDPWNGQQQLAALEGSAAEIGRAP